MPVLSKRPKRTLCPVCHSYKKHDRQLCSNSPETLADFYAGVQSDTAETIGPNPNVGTWARGYDSWKLANGGR